MKKKMVRGRTAVEQSAEGPQKRVLARRASALRSPSEAPKWAPAAAAEKVRSVGLLRRSLGGQALESG